MQKNIILGVVGVLAELVLVWAVAFLRPYHLKGSQIDPPVPAPDIS